ncbi:MAG: tetratricopeptide repeat protein [Cellvibrionaceae bacterium]
MPRLRIFALLALASHTTWAASIPELQQLLDEKKYGDAWIAANQLRNDQEGNEVFDFFYGLAALETANVDEALFAFERVLFVNPNHHRARLEMARCYFLLGDMDSAETALLAVENVNPPENVRKNIQKFREKIDSVKSRREITWRPRMELAGGVDSNANSATADDGWVLEIPGITGVIANPESLEQDDNYYSGNIGLGAYFPINKLQQVGFDVSLSDRVYDDVEGFDQTIGNVFLSYQHRVNRQILSLGLKHQQFKIEGDDFQKSDGLILGWASQKRTGSTQANLLYSEIEYDGSPGRDISQAVAAFASSWRAETVNHSMTLLFGFEETLENTATYNAKDFTGLMYQVRWSLAENVQAKFRAFGQMSEYDDVYLPFTEIRDDEMVQLGVGLSWRFAKNYSAFLDVSHTDNRSNITAFTYDRLNTKLGVRYGFN